MSFDSLFDNALKMADQVIEDVMASEFRLQLRDGTNLDIKAIFDAKYEPANRSENRPIFIAEEGVLTVYQQRLDKRLIEGACVYTPLGARYVADVYYPEPKVSLIILTQHGRSNHNGNFLK